MKFKSKSLISIILSIMMVISMILVAIPANAAVVDSEPVGAGASSGIIPAGEYLYYDFTAVGSGQVNYCGDNWAWIEANYDVSSGIIEIKLKSNMNFNNPGNNVLCKTKKGDWTNLATTVPGDGQNMVVVASDGKSYTWSTYSGSSTEKHTVSKGTETNGKFTVSPTSAAEGDTVTVTTTPDSGYEVDTVTYTPVGGSAKDATGSSSNTYTFTMPAANVTVNVTFKQTSTSDTITVYFDNSTKKWSSVNCYAWQDSDGNNKNAAWPGEAMTKVDDTGNIYSITLSNNLDKCIFNDGTNQTGNLNVTAGKMYKPNDDKWVDYPETPTPTTSYYLTGRFGIKKDGKMTYLGGSLNSWVGDNTSDITFTQVSDSTLYKLETGQTIKELAANTGDNIWFFQISDGTTKYRPDTDTDKELTISDNNTEFGTGTKAGSFHFTGNDETGNVTLYFDSSSNKFHFEVEGGTDTPGTLTSGTTVYVRSSTEIKAATLSTTLNSDPQETDIVMSKAGDFNAKYYYSYQLTNAADNVTFTVNFKDTTIPSVTKSAACVAGKNVYDVDTNTWSAYDIDKANAYSSGLWVDVQPTVKNSSVALIKWSNQYGSNGTLSNNEYRLYLPSGVTLSTLPIYSKFSSLTINGSTVKNGEAYSSLTAGTTYAVVGDGNTYNLKVFQSDAASIYTSTPSGDLPTKTDNDLLSKYKAEGYKPSFKNGSFMTVSENGSIKNSLTTLVQVKGRGNSSWESSCEHFGKYAYNIKLSSKIDPLGMGATKAKSFCMLANNMDEAQLRNLMTYQMGLDANIPFTPHFKAVDWYNNGTYLGSYLITEKVDVGSSKLVKGTTVEDNHEYDADNATKTQDKYVNSYGSITYQYVNTGNYTPGKKADGTTDTNDTYEKKSYLLEFDLEKRARAENSWFKSPKGQYIAIKSYEDLNQAEMKFIIDKWCEAEDAVYKGNYDKANSLMDLDSFAQVYLVQELSKNLDSCATSYYVYYDGTQASPKWQATPLWDYDWAYGIYTLGGNKAINTSGENHSNDLTAIGGWFAKYKYLTQDGEQAIENKPYSFQAQLCTMPDFWNGNVKGVWNGGFYQSAVSAFGKYNSSSDITSGKINTVYDSIDASIAMNEARYGFVKDDPIKSWGSLETNENPDDAYAYFKNWTAERIDWMATTGGLGTPVALTNVTLGAPTEVTVGDSITLTATVTPSTATGVTYTFYQGTEVLASKSESNTYTVTPSAAGAYTFKVVATDGLTEVVSDDISVTVKPLSITGVTLKSSNSSVKPGVEFTLTATAAPGGLSGVTYTFYQSSDSTVSIDTDTSLESTGNTATVTAESTPGSYYYYVVAKDANDVEKTSSIVTVKVTNEGAVIDSVKIRFKGTTLSSLIPYMSVDGETATVMTRSTANDALIGTHLSGAYRFVWFEATIPTVTVGQSKTLTFTTENSKESTMKASITLDFTTCDSDNVIYLAVDNLMSGTTAVDITNNETAKTSFGSAMNMIKQSSASDPVATTLLSTMLKVTSASGQVKTKRYYLGDLDSDNTIGIKDATEIQKSITGSSELDAEYKSLGDFNADGVVDIKDATAIQKYIAGI